MAILLEMPGRRRSGLDDVFCGDIPTCEDVSRIDDQRRPFAKSGIVHIVVIGRDQNSVKGADGLLVPSHGFHAHQVAIFPGFRDFCHVRIIIGRFAAALLNKFYEFQRRTFTNIGHIFLVGETDHQHLGAAERLAGTDVEGFRDPPDDMTRHAGVDFAA